MTSFRIIRRTKWHSCAWNAQHRIIVAGILSWDMGHWGSLAGSNVLLGQHRLRGLVSKGWAPRSKRSHLIYPCKQVTEAKSKAQSSYGCMWLHWLFHSPSAVWPSCFNSLSFISVLCHPSPASLSEHSLSVSVSVLLPATSSMLLCCCSYQ
jgi:hypothetical protein